MGTENFLASLNLPASCALGKTIFKKQFYDNAGLSTTDKKLITNNVEKVIWQYCLKPDTINIQSYVDEGQEYLEVQVIEARLKDKARHQRIAEIIMRAIPYPMILQLTLSDEMMVVAGLPRMNLADRQKHTIDDFVYSPWIDCTQLTPPDRDFLNSVQASHLSVTNFYRYYSDFIAQLHLFNAAKLVGKTLPNQDPQKAQKAYEEITGLEKELVSLRAQMKKETMFNRKVELNILIKKKQQKIENLIKQIG